LDAPLDGVVDKRTIVSSLATASLHIILTENKIRKFCCEGHSASACDITSKFFLEITIRLRGRAVSILGRAELDCYGAGQGSQTRRPHMAARAFCAARGDFWEFQIIKMQAI